MRGIGGKFQKTEGIGVRSLRQFREGKGIAGCMKKLEECEYGIVRGKTWWMRLGGEYRKVVEVLWEERNGELAGRKLERICKTVGCVNEEHYELLNEKERLMVNDGRSEEHTSELQSH